MRNVGEEREDVLKEVNQALIHNGYETKVCEVVGSNCFDIVAKRKERMLIIKVLVNVDNYTREQARDLKKITKTITAIPILIGLRTRRSELIEGVIHERYGLKVVGVDTFKNALKNDAPAVLIKRGGAYVRINGKRLRRARIRYGFSLGELAKKVGVSRKAIYEYENENMCATLEVALKLEEILGERLIEPLNLFEEVIKNERHDEIGINNTEQIAIKAKEALAELGLKAEALKRAPFNVIAADEVYSLRMIAEAKQTIDEIKRIKVKTVKELAEVMDAKALVMVERESGIDDLEGVPVIDILRLKRGDIPEILGI